MPNPLSDLWRLENTDFQDSDSLQSILRSILLSVPDAMIVIDDTGIIMAFSRAAENLFGYKSEDVVGTNIKCLMTQSDQTHHDQYIRNYLTTGERQIIGIGRIVEARLANGDSIPVELKIGEASIGGRKLFTGFIRDITEKQANMHRIGELQAELGNFSRLSAVGTMASAMA
ncbi:MAG TPA: PAS domain-containing sensor histidine kinase, partial [Hyphomonas sp.]|nr:PAS domain-containing sensor histidine kinase [Hyphomonas sp.]